MEFDRSGLRHRGLARRRLVQAGSLGVLGLSLPDLLVADEIRPAGSRPRADACILLFLNGGPSHLDTWDMKPDAPAEIRGEFKPIPSSFVGVPICEHLPRLSRWMGRCTLVRSVHHTVNNAHARAVYTALTGHDRGDATVAIGASPVDYPAIGSVVARRRPPDGPAVGSVVLPYITKEGAGGPPQPGFFGGWLGKGCDPLFILRDPNAANFAIPELTPATDLTEQRVLKRKDLLRRFDRPAASSLRRESSRSVDAFRQRAFDLLSSEQVRRAFRIEQEPEPLRDSYGRNIYGQSVLLARRLVEAGTRVVTISWAPDANATWDTHGNNFRSLKGTLLPDLDAALSSLISDLQDRRMLERTLIVVMGEFGRTPKINAAAGRDHWNFCYSVLFAGGGMKEGFVYGSSDKIGAKPQNLPCGPADIVASIYHALGVPHRLELADQLDRPLALVPWGDPIEALFA